MNPGSPYVCVIGAACVDIDGRSYAALQPHDSNPGQMHVSWGGVGRNIAENLARLDVPVQMITLLGEDEYGRQLAEHARSVGIEFHAMTVAGAVTPTYLSISDKDGEMSVSVAAMDVLEHLTVDFLQKHFSLIENARYCVIDANLSADVLQFLLSQFPDVAMCMDLVSVSKTDRVMGRIKGLHLLKANRAEAEHLSGMRISDVRSLPAIAEHFHQQDIAQVLISLGSDGLFYSNGQSSGRLKADSDIRIVNSNGAGDALLAGMLYSAFQDLDFEESAINAVAASLITLEHSSAVNPEMSPFSLTLAMARVAKIAL